MRIAPLAVALLALAVAVPHARAADPIELKFGFPPPPTTPYYPGNAQPWAKQVEEGSGGAVKIQFFVGGSVVNFRNVYDRVVNGVTEIGMGALQDVGGQFPKTEVASLPFEADHAVDASVALWRIYDHGVIADEFARIKPLALFGFPMNGLHSSKPIAKIEDMKGAKTLVQTAMLGQAVTLYGGTPLTFTIAEMYQALERGTANAMVLGWVGMMTYKMHEVVKYHLDIPLGTSLGYWFMNKDAYAKLPEAARAAIDKASYENLSKAIGTVSDRSDGFVHKQVLEAPGQVMTKIDAAETERFKRALAPLTDQWIKATPDGRKVLDAFRAEVAKFKNGG